MPKTNLRIVYIRFDIYAKKPVGRNREERGTKTVFGIYYHDMNVTKSLMNIEAGKIGF